MEIKQLTPQQTMDKEEIMKLILKLTETNANGYTTHQNIWNTTNLILTEKLTASSNYIKINKKNLK